VHGDRGSAVIDNDQLAFFHATAKGSEPDEKLMGTTQSTSAAGPTAGSDPGQLSDAHRLQYLNFLGALDGTGELRVDLATNRQSIGVITGAYESARTGRPVRLG
jgi:predicted dehydrogenase